MTNAYINVIPIILGVIFLISFSEADIAHPPTLMLNEIKAMARDRRTPIITVGLLRKCENSDSEEKNKIDTEWGKCVAQYYKGRGGRSIESIAEDCKAFDESKYCYEPVIKFVNTCYHEEGADGFQFTTALMNFVCSHQGETLSEVEGNTRKFSAFTNEYSTSIDSCLIGNFLGQIHNRSELCKSRSILEHCLKKYIKPDTSPDHTVHYFDSMMKSLEEQLLCGVIQKTSSTTPPSASTPRNVTEAKEKASDKNFASKMSNTCLVSILFSLAGLFRFNY